MMATVTGFIVECTAGVPTGHAGSARTRGRGRAPVGPWRRPFWATRGPAARDRLSSRRTDPQVPMRHALTPSRIVGRRGIRGALVYGEAHRRVDTSMGFSVVRGDGLQSETPRKRARRTGLGCTASCRATPHTARAWRADAPGGRPDPDAAPSVPRRADRRQDLVIGGEPTVLGDVPGDGLSTHVQRTTPARSTRKWPTCMAYSVSRTHPSRPWPRGARRDRPARPGASSRPGSASALAAHRSD